jgi:MoaA/NifB/PqqE/SkfB family radical SAM enzyme
MSIIWIPTWRCQNQCNYCDYRLENDHICLAFGTKISAREIEGDHWITFFKRLGKNHIELTGGEPTLYKPLPEILRSLPGTWAITTNLLDKAVRELPLENCTCITASYHRNNDKKFFSNVDYFVEKNALIRVTIVATPYNLPDLKDEIANIRSHKVNVNIHPILQQDFEWPQPLYDFIHEMHNPPEVFVVKDIPPKWQEGQRHSRCSLGDSSYMVLGPDGAIYRCYNDLVRGVNISDIGKPFMRRKSRECDVNCCFPCDSQAFTRLNGARRY